MSDNEKRSTDKEIHLVPPLTSSNAAGVGARHSDSLPLDGVGGYLDICSISRSSLLAELRKNDSRLQDLKDMGLSHHLLKIAEAIGYEAFITLWLMVGGEEPIRMRMPPISKYRRFQRNRLIKKLAAEGMRRSQIKKYIKKNLCEDVTRRHIDRLCSKFKVNQ